jgi:hypothetical protein
MNYKKDSNFTFEFNKKKKKLPQINKLSCMRLKKKNYPKVEKLTFERQESLHLNNLWI